MTRTRTGQCDEDDRDREDQDDRDGEDQDQVSTTRMGTGTRTT